MIQIRRSAKAQRARIIVSVDKVEVVAPINMPEQQIARFIALKQAWIASAKVKLRLKAPVALPLATTHYQEGTLIPYQGNHYPLMLQPTMAKKWQVSFDSGFYVTLPAALNDTAIQSLIKTALSEWMKKTIKKQIDHYIQQHSQRFNLMPTVVRVKTQKSRWGSCSGTNAININWLLILAPPVILEYVVVHELCHIQEKNHSQAFWTLVAAHLPNYQQHRSWLKQHGTRLMRGL